MIQEKLSATPVDAQMPNAVPSRQLLLNVGSLTVSDNRFNRIHLRFVVISGQVLDITVAQMNAVREILGKGLVPIPGPTDLMKCSNVPVEILLISRPRIYFAKEMNALNLNVVLFPQ